MEWILPDVCKPRNWWCHPWFALPGRLLQFLVLAIVNSKFDGFLSVGCFCLPTAYSLFFHVSRLYRASRLILTALLQVHNERRRSRAEYEVLLFAEGRSIDECPSPFSLSTWHNLKPSVRRKLSGGRWSVGMSGRDCHDYYKIIVIVPRRSYIYIRVCVYTYMCVHIHNCIYIHLHAWVIALASKQCCSMASASILPWVTNSKLNCDLEA